MISTADMFAFHIQSAMLYGPLHTARLQGGTGVTAWLSTARRGVQVSLITQTSPEQLPGFSTRIRVYGMRRIHTLPDHYARSEVSDIITCFLLT